MAFVDFKKAEEVQEYLKNIHVEYLFSCHNEKNAEGCHLLGDYTEAILKNPEEAYSLYKENCNLRKFPQSCYKYGRYLMRGKYEPADPDRAYDALKLSCDNDWFIACPEVALILFKGTKQHPVDVPKAFQLLEKSCEANLMDACYWLHGKYYAGFKGIKPDLEKAFKCAMRSCMLGMSQGCDRVSEHYERGEGVEKDAAKSKWFADLAAEIREDIKSAVPSGLTG